MENGKMEKRLRCAATRHLFMALKFYFNVIETLIYSRHCAMANATATATAAAARTVPASSSEYHFNNILLLRKSGNSA